MVPDIHRKERERREKEEENEVILPYKEICPVAFNCKRVCVCN